MDERRVWTAMRCFFVEPDQVSKFVSKFKSEEQLGSTALPEPQTDYKTYAGEIPWSRHFGDDLRDSGGTAIPDDEEAFQEFRDGARQSGIMAEVAVHRVMWEKYRSESNSGYTAYLPALSLCEQLNLCNRKGIGDLFDQAGDRACIYRVLGEKQDNVSGRLTCLRLDLLGKLSQRRGVVQSGCYGVKEASVFEPSHQ